MKKTIQILATVIFFMGMLAGCRKTIADTSSTLGNGNTSYYIKTNTTIGYQSSTGVRLDSLITTYTYDGQNRCTQYVTAQYNFDNGQTTLTIDTTTITYTSKTIAVKDNTAYATYYLNTAGTLADSAQSGPIGGTGYSMAKYFYDANGYVTSFKRYNYKNGQYSLSDSSIYSIVNGNTTKYSFVNFSGSSSSYSESLTFTDQTTTSYFSVPTYSPGNGINTGGIEGHANVNLYSTETDAATVLKYSYTLDSQNRVTTLTSIPNTNTNTSFSFTFRFTYY